MTLHDNLLAALQSIADVKLVARLADSRLDFPTTEELRVFIPDVHLITRARRESAGFVYSTNYLPLLLQLVQALRGIQGLVLHQIGDLIDLWRETDGLDPDVDVASAIVDDHEALMEALLDPALNTQFLLGNHDYDLFRFHNFSAWKRHVHVGRSVMVLHGDVFDWVEQLPQQVKNFFVFLFSPFLQPSSVQLEAMRPLNQTMRAGRRFRNYIRNASPAPLGRMLDRADTLPARWNVQTAGQFLGAARDKAAEANAQFGAAIKVVVIGHTHHARIAVREDGDELFTLMDCGAWIENCTTADDPTPRPNAQIGALGANDARVYQLAPLGG